MAAPWAETTLATILSHYLLENIFSTDKLGLFYQYLPNKALHLKKCSGRKHSRVRLTGLTAGNAYGERLQMFVIGKSVTPRFLKMLKLCFADTVFKIKVGCLESFLKIGYISRIKNLPNLRERLIINNCTAHPHVENLKWVELIFLPSNATSHTQPTDQGII